MRSENSAKPAIVSTISSAPAIGQVASLQGSARARETGLPGIARVLPSYTTMTITTDRKVELLGTVALFDGIGPDGLAAVAEQAEEVDFPAGRSIVRQGEIGTGFFLITAGRTRVVRDGETLAELGPGEFFGELSLLDGEPRIAAVVSETPTTCLAIPSWKFDTLLEAQPRLAVAILRVVARRLRNVTEAHRH